MSTVISDNTEWMLSIKLFKILWDKFQFSPQVDLFATCLNKQIDKYVSWMPDPYCIAVNAFKFSWKTHKIYAFPPFSSVFREKLKKSSLQSGNLKLPQNTNLSLTDGNFFVYEGVKIIIHHP